MEEGNQVHRIENDINLIQQVPPSNQSRKDPGGSQSIEYENDEEKIVCSRFPHLDMCACEISCEIALREINLF